MAHRRTMSRRLTLLSISALLAAVPAAHAAPVPRTLALGPASALGMDGPLVGAAVQGRTCQVVAWNVLSGRHTRLGGCHEQGTSTGSGLVELAVAGPRGAWIDNEGGNSEQDEDLLSSSLSDAWVHGNGSASRSGSVDGGWLRGDWFAGLVGEGRELRVGHWRTSFEIPANCDELNES